MNYIESPPSPRAAPTTPKTPATWASCADPDIDLTHPEVLNLLKNWKSRSKGMAVAARRMHWVCFDLNTLSSKKQKLAEDGDSELIATQL